MKKSNERVYTWSYVTYANEEQVKSFCNEQGNNWAYAFHNNDNKEPHYHVVVTFEQQKSRETALRLAKTYFTDCNTLLEPVKDLGGALLYLTHETEQAKADGKYQYDREIVKYSKSEWYKKYVKGEEVSENEQFVTDLLSKGSDFSIRTMAKRYGRDFIRNMGKYLEFRAYALAEEQGVYVPLQYAQDHRIMARDVESFCEGQKIAEQNEQINDFIKGE